MTNDWPGIIAFLVWSASTVAVFVGRHWLISRIAKRVEHDFNIKLETIRADLRTTEEQLKSELRDKEAEISALRANLLSGSENRQLQRQPS